MERACLQIWMEKQISWLNFLYLFMYKSKIMKSEGIFNYIFFSNAPLENPNRKKPSCFNHTNSATVSLNRFILSFHTPHFHNSELKLWNLYSHWMALSNHIYFKWAFKKEALCQLRSLKLAMHEKFLFEIKSLGHISSCTNKTVNSFLFS